MTYLYILKLMNIGSSAEFLFRYMNLNMPSFDILLFAAE